MGGASVIAALRLLAALTVLGGIYAVTIACAGLGGYVRGMSGSSFVGPPKKQ